MCTSHPSSAYRSQFIFIEDLLHSNILDSEVIEMNKRCFYLLFLHISQDFSLPPRPYLCSTFILWSLWGLRSMSPTIHQEAFLKRGRKSIKGTRCSVFFMLPCVIFNIITLIPSWYVLVNLLIVFYPLSPPLTSSLQPCQAEPHLPHYHRPPRPRTMSGT